jgi:hypothetical protein
LQQFGQNQKNKDRISICPCRSRSRRQDAVRPKFTFFFPGYIGWFSYSVNYFQLHNQSGIILSVFNEKEGNVEGLRFLFAISNI